MNSIRAYLIIDNLLSNIWLRASVSMDNFGNILLLFNLCQCLPTIGNYWQFLTTCCNILLVLTTFDTCWHFFNNFWQLLVKIWHRLPTLGDFATFDKFLQHLCNFCHPVVLSSYHPVILSSFHLVILSSLHIVILSFCHLVSLAAFQFVSLSIC